jgi:chorismate mutase
MMTELESNRVQLLLKTQNIVSLILSRKNIVTKIQSLKNSEQKFENFDISREVFVFANLKDLSTLSFHELLSLSLLIEGQAGSCEGRYPAWSKGEHLDLSAPTSIEQQINPILLATAQSKSYDSLPLNVEFKQAINKALGTL